MVEGFECCDCPLALVFCSGAHPGGRSSENLGYFCTQKAEAMTSSFTSVALKAHLIFSKENTESRPDLFPLGISFGSLGQLHLFISECRSPAAMPAYYWGSTGIPVGAGAEKPMRWRKRLTLHM